MLALKVANKPNWRNRGNGHFIYPPVKSTSRQSKTEVSKVSITFTYTCLAENATVDVSCEAPFLELGVS